MIIISNPLRSRLLSWGPYAVFRFCNIFRERRVSYVLIYIVSGLLFIQRCASRVFNPSGVRSLPRKYSDWRRTGTVLHVAFFFTFSPGATTEYTDCSMSPWGRIRNAWIADHDADMSTAALRKAKKRPTTAESWAFEDVSMMYTGVHRYRNALQSMGEIQRAAHCYLCLLRWPPYFMANYR